MPRSSGCRPTTSTSTRCTTSTGARRGTRSGRPWRSCATRARSSTSARRTSPAGTSPRPRAWPPSATSWAWSREQSIYNLIQRKVELEVLPAAEDFGLGVIPWSPLHGGLLGGVVRKERDGLAALRRSVGRRHRGPAGPARAVRGPVRGDRRGAGHRRTGLVADPARRHRAHRRAPARRAPRRGHPGHRDHPRRQGARPASTRSSPATSPHPRSTPGERLFGHGAGRPLEARPCALLGRSVPEDHVGPDHGQGQLRHALRARARSAPRAR